MTQRHPLYREGPEPITVDHFSEPGRRYLVVAQAQGYRVTFEPKATSLPERRLITATIHLPAGAPSYFRDALLAAHFFVRNGNEYCVKEYPDFRQAPIRDDHEAQIQATLTAARAFGYCTDVHSAQDGDEMVISITYRRAS
jgi:hypothetical protein